MKILLREHYDQDYVWKTAKYNGEYFEVNGRIIEEFMIVSVINDNRKNYVKCSSCGKVFPKNGNKFEKHKEAARGITPCLTCRKVRPNELKRGVPKYTLNGDGTFTQVVENKVELICKNYYWQDYPINSDDAINNCKYRLCGDAHGMEITDTFIDYPGIFDDIITVDKILDKGYVKIGYHNSRITEYVLDEEIGISAWVNRLGIIDRFSIDSGNGWGYHVYYSKKYNELYDNDDRGRYQVWNVKLDEEKKSKFKELIMSFYK